ncbi:MAG: POTRA domain-containing protein, partial [Bacteroidota bacterium]|nr:POTRA domain-containing protein [Bacteroidota bacterium]
MCLLPAYPFPALQRSPLRLTLLMAMLLVAMLLMAMLLMAMLLLPPVLRAQSTEGGESTRSLPDSAAALHLGSLSMTGNAAIPRAQLREDIDASPGQPFAEAALQRDIARMLDRYDRAGYPFAAVRIVALELRRSGDSALVDIRLRIDEGPLFRIHEITVTGNTVTDADVIIRETRIDEGEIYDAEKVRDIRRRLGRLQYFDRVSDPQLTLRGDSIGGLRIDVVEGSTNRFDGVVGYQPAQDSEEGGYFTGLVDLRFGNLFGTGRRLTARWERASRQSSELALHYLEPWLFGFPLNIAVGFFQRQQDSAYVRRAADAEISLLATTDVTVAATLEGTEVIPSVNSALPGLYRSSTVSAGLQLRIDTRDDVYNPRDGIFLRNAYSGGDKSFTPPGESPVRDFIQRIELDAEYYFEAVPRVVMALALHGRELTGDELDASDLYRVGGANTLRGYREEQFS